jgi:hypothetical protein
VGLQFRGEGGVRALVSCVSARTCEHVCVCVCVWMGAVTQAPSHRRSPSLEATRPGSLSALLLPLGPFELTSSSSRCDNSVWSHTETPTRTHTRAHTHTTALTTTSTVSGSHAQPPPAESPPVVPVVSQYVIGPGPSGLTLVPQASMTIAGVSVAWPTAATGAASATVLTFSRPFTAGGYTGAQPIAQGTTTTAAAPTYVVYAWGPAGSPLVTSGHLPLSSGVVSIAFNALTAAPAIPPAPPVTAPTTAEFTFGLAAHAAIMVVAWLVLISGVLIARYTRHIAPTFGPNAFWFTRHWILQSGGGVLVLVAAGLGIVFAPAELQFRTAHSFIGIIIVAGVGVQVGPLHRALHLRQRIRCLSTAYSLLSRRSIPPR